MRNESLLNEEVNPIGLPWRYCTASETDRQVNRTGFIEGSVPREDGPDGTPDQIPPELRERAVRMVFARAHEHPSQWGTIRSVAEKLACTTAALGKAGRAR
jgi:hypothetical protein